MKKKVFAAVLAASMLMMTACGSTQETIVDGGSDKETDSEVTSEVTEGDAEGYDSADPQEDVIIPLFPSESDGQIHSLSPEELQQGSNVISLFKAYDTHTPFGDVDEGMYAAYLYTTEYLNRSFEIGYQDQKETGVTVTIFFIGPIEGTESEENHVFDCLYYEIEGGESGTFVRFMPLYYNQTKQCLVGYQRQEGEYSLYEIYWDGTWFSSQPVTDMSIYGF